ncbi:hypothetical protein J7J90_05110 [Candidatus Micrarchaeota archaeon]|nr:hypothetical protein [Candidatus Micrarchaeota archaeon]
MNTYTLSRLFRFNLVVLMLALSIFFLAGCINLNSYIANKNNNHDSGHAQVQIAISECVSYCNHAKSNGTVLSDGPCLSENYVNDWVCDVAHSPRQPVDNLPENQCPAFRQGKAHHFVEVDEDCNVIRVY